ncbi:MAG: 16S rRNA (cytidine(1402)-2'-O)-methyltransferase [Acidobacteriaceae bacterium]
MARVHEELAAGLYVVATPIGNLEDISLRALRILREADVIACEDTRHTQKLLNHFDIKAQTVSYHEHNEAQRAQELVEQIKSGKRVALVSDAGTPAVSDPGYRVVQASIAAGIVVVPVPGAAAAVTALVASGLPPEPYYFGGFLPARSGERRTLLEAQCTRRETMIFYEAPHRLLEALADIESTMGAQRPVVVARELTKLHEEFVRGAAGEVRTKFAEAGEVRGEITLLIGGASAGEGALAGKSLAARMRELLARGDDEKAALKTAAKEFGLGKSEAYREWQRAKK